MTQASARKVEPQLGAVPDQAASVGAAVRRPLRALLESRRLSPAQRRIARYLMDHADEAAFLSSVDLAQRVGVSQPSATRFAAALGFDGYPQLRETMRSWMLRPEGTPQGGEGGNEFQRIIAHEIRNLAALAEQVQDPSAVTEVGRQLAGSRPLVVVGIRVSAPIASLFAYLARKVHPDVRLVTGADSTAEDLVSQARDAGASSALVFGLPRHPRELLPLIAWIRGTGLRVCLVTDQAVSPLAEAADTVLVAAVGADLVFDSQAAPMALCSILLQAMFDHLPAGQQQRIEDYETGVVERRLFIAT